VPQNVRNIFDETGEWARSSFDHPHQFIASGVVQFPFFDGDGGVTEAVLGGWRVNAIVVAQSGAPFTVNLGIDRANIGAGPAQRPDQIRDPNLPGGEVRRSPRVLNCRSLRPASFEPRPRYEGGRPCSS
jgi:hypothetical protein